MSPFAIAMWSSIEVSLTKNRVIIYLYKSVAVIVVRFMFFKILYYIMVGREAEFNGTWSTVHTYMYCKIKFCVSTYVVLNRNVPDLL
jgi:hypothetical protein